MLPLDQIRSTLPTLSETDLRDLKTQINVLLGLGNSGVAVGDDLHTDEVLILRLISATLNRINGTPLVLHAKNSPVRAVLRQRLPDLMQYLKPIDERYRTGFLEMALSLLAENIQQQDKIPLTLSVMVQQLSRLPAVIDQAFPSYWESGLLNKIVRAYEGRR